MYNTFQDYVRSNLQIMGEFPKCDNICQIFLWWVSHCLLSIGDKFISSDIGHARNGIRKSCLILDRRCIVKLSGIVEIRYHDLWRCTTQLELAKEMSYMQITGLCTLRLITAKITNHAQNYAHIASFHTGASSKCKAWRKMRHGQSREKKKDPKGVF